MSLYWHPLGVAEKRRFPPIFLVSCFILVDFLAECDGQHVFFHQ